MAKAEKIALWMRSQLSAAGARGFVIGLSGGVDSAVVARLAQMAAPGAVVAALLPCHSVQDDERDAVSVAEHFAIPAVRVDLSAAYDALRAAAEQAVHLIPDGGRVGEGLEPLDPVGGRLPSANIKPRLRMTT